MSIESRRDEVVRDREHQLLRPERLAWMLRVVTAKGHATVGELAEGLRVSVSTVRRDLGALSDTGALERVHGGAVLCGWPYVAFRPPHGTEASSSGAVARTVGG